jgi:hypothetical protein
MHRREFVNVLVRGAAACALGGGAGSVAPSFAASLAVDDRAMTRVVDPLLMTADPVRAVTTDAGFLVRFEDDGRRATLVERRVEGTTDLAVKLERVRWSYHAEGLVERRTLPLKRYRSSISNAVHERDAVLSGEKEEVRKWFLGHERLFQRMSSRLCSRLQDGWEAGGSTLLHRFGRLRGELDEDLHVQVAPGESYRISLAGSEPDTEGDRIDLRYDRAKDLFDVTLVVAPRGASVEHLSPHRERLKLTGDGSMLPTRYALTLWQDKTVGAGYREGKGSDHPLYARKARDARRLVDLFPRYL